MTLRLAFVHGKHLQSRSGHLRLTFFLKPKGWHYFLTSATPRVRNLPRKNRQEHQQASRPGSHNRLFLDPVESQIKQTIFSTGYLKSKPQHIPENPSPDFVTSQDQTAIWQTAEVMLVSGTHHDLMGIILCLSNFISGSRIFIRSTSW